MFEKPGVILKSVQGVKLFSNKHCDFSSFGFRLAFSDEDLSDYVEVDSVPSSIKNIDDLKLVNYSSNQKEELQAKVLDELKNIDDQIKHLHDETAKAFQDLALGQQNILNKLDDIEVKMERRFNLQAMSMQSRERVNVEDVLEKWWPKKIGTHSILMLRTDNNSNFYELSFQTYLITLREFTIQNR